MSNNDEATTIFISKIQNARERMQEIQAHLDEHLGYNPMEIDWSHVGTAQHILDQLDDALTTCENTGSK